MCGCVAQGHIPSSHLITVLVKGPYSLTVSVVIALVHASPCQNYQFGQGMKLHVAMVGVGGCSLSYPCGSERVSVQSRNSLFCMCGGLNVCVNGWE